MASAHIPHDPYQTLTLSTSLKKSSSTPSVMGRYRRCGRSLFHLNSDGIRKSGILERNLGRLDLDAQHALVADIVRPIPNVDVAGVVTTVRANVADRLVIDVKNDECAGPFGRTGKGVREGHGASRHVHGGLGALGGGDGGECRERSDDFGKDHVVLYWR